MTEKEQLQQKEFLKTAYLNEISRALSRIRELETLNMILERDISSDKRKWNSIASQLRIIEDRILEEEADFEDNINEIQSLKEQIENCKQQIRKL